MSRFLLFLLFLFFFCFANGQKLPFKSYANIKDLNEPVSVITRDNRGLLWIGTPFGIKWFDGTHVYNPPIEAKTGQLYVNNFYKDLNGDIWVLTFYNGIYHYKNGKFINYLPAPSQLVSGQNSAFHLLQYDQKKFIVSTDKDLYWFDKNSFRQFDPRNILPNQNFNSIVKIKDGQVLLAHEQGLYHCLINGDSLKNVTVHLKDHQISRILLYNTEIWVATNKGLYQYRDINSLIQNRHDQIFFKGKKISNIAISQKKEIWAISDKVYKITGEKIVQYDESNGLPLPYNIYSDAGTTWFLSTSGLTSLSNEHYAWHDLLNSGINAMTISLGKDENNALWFGSYNGLSKKTAKGYENYTTAEGRQIGYTPWMMKTESGQLLAGTESGVVELGKHIHSKYKIVTSRGYEDRHGRLWFGTENGRLFIVLDRKLQEIQLPISHKDYIDAIQIDRNDLLWIGFRSYGLIKFKLNGLQPEYIEEYSAKTGFNDLRIRCVATDRNGNLLFGTRTNGLYIFSVKDSKQWHINTTNGLSGNWVKHISVDHNNHIFLATNKGVNIIEKGNYAKPVIKNVNLSHDGVEKSTNALLIDTGVVWGGTDEGLFEYFPKKDLSDTTPPPVYFTRIRINGLTDSTLIPYTANIAGLRLAHDSNVIDFEFAGVNLQGEGIRYSYFLVGQNKPWSEPTDRNFVSYHLPPGSYQFQVIAINKDGVKSLKPATIDFVIRAPFWQQWWFITLGIAFLSFLIYAGYQYRIRQILKVEGIRRRISTDLHDEIGSTLSSISILSEVSIQEESFSQSKKNIKEIKESSLLLMEKMDDIIWSVNPQKDTIEEVALRIKRFAGPLFEAKDIDYTIDIDDALKSMVLNMEFRQHLYLIIKEAVNNLVKYSDCSHALIHIKGAGGILKVHIEDNGKGFDTSLTPPGNGLLNMRTRAEKMHALLRIHSGKGLGTKIQLETKIK
jgi:ligand-binding sensor domain-containing protein/two-component sensor histidine kinase